MNYAIKRICCLLLLLLVSTTAHAVEFTDGARARAVLTSQVKKLFENGKFADLDSMADHFRENKSRLPDGNWKLLVFYTGFDLATNAPEPDFQRAMDLANKWRKSNPKSVTAQCVQASLWIDYAWKARGSGYANEVKEDAWPLIRERLDKSWQIINEPLALNIADCPRRQNLRLVIAKMRGVNKRDYEDLFKEALSQSPDYYLHYATKADYLLPKWYGQEGEWQSFLMEIADQNPGREGATIYARTVWSLYAGKSIKNFEGSGVSWPKMREGFEEITRNYPNSPWILNITAKFACWAGDMELLRSLMERIDKNNFYSEAWADRSFDICRGSVRLPPLR